MKKYRSELIIILVLSSGTAFLLPNFFKERDTLIVADFSEFATWFLVTFVVLTALVFSFKEKEKLLSLPDGYHKLYNERGQTTQEGIFKRGALFNGSKHIYKKDGTHSHTEIYENGSLLK